MRVLRITEATIPRECSTRDMAQTWVVRQLQAAGFDLTSEVIYQYSAKTKETLFLQYLDTLLPEPAGAA